MVGPDLHAGPGLTRDRDRREGHVSEATHAESGEPASSFEPTARSDAGIKNPRPARSRVYDEAQFIRACYQRIGELPRTFIHSEPAHTAGVSISSSRYATAAAGMARAAAAPRSLTRSCAASPASIAAALAMNVPCPATTATRGHRA